LGQRLSAESVRQHTLTCHSASTAVIDAFNQAIAEWQQSKTDVTSSHADSYSFPPRPSSRNRVSPDGWSGNAETLAERGRSWTSVVLDQSSQFGDILRRSVSTSRRAARAGAQRTSALLANLQETSRARRPPARERRISETRGSRHSQTRATGTNKGANKGANEPASASDRWYERQVASKLR
jgi:hypothetical protein